MTKHSINNINDGTCLNDVTQHLRQLDNKMQQNQTKLNVKREQLSDYLPIIETFVWTST